MPLNCKLFIEDVDDWVTELRLVIYGESQAFDTLRSLSGSDVEMIFDLEAGRAERRRQPASIPMLYQPGQRPREGNG